jgi:hypothetical protein
MLRSSRKLATLIEKQISRGVHRSIRELVNDEFPSALMD